jgi:hypothetical protein
MHEQPGASTELPPPTLDMERLTALGLADRIEVWRAACLDAEKF